ncbi:hypothetical protein HaLaN_31000 [Haematococcus lacustris]|uniref:Secreted protein n=1 Tax=Haematococcus lacustris TaxID=44745 RepID=A0A6A0AJ57_HAELA|nr:hypothetical protein HaLaN_31000 [Haematococcus lacustris]
MIFMLRILTLHHTQIAAAVTPTQPGGTGNMQVVIVAFHHCQERMRHGPAHRRHPPCLIGSHQPAATACYPDLACCHLLHSTTPSHPSQTPPFHDIGLKSRAATLQPLGRG